MTEKRVSFDFDIAFSNGGGMQGQGFRLDINGVDISDDELAAYIIKDLRLLMVGSVTILNKEIIEEPHKRTEIEALSESAGIVTEFIDLSHTIKDGMITYKGLPAPLICDHLSFTQSHDHYDAGTEFTIAKIEMVANTGTYLDTPDHRYRDGHDLNGLVLEKVSNVPAVVVRATGMMERGIDWMTFAPIDVAEKAVLINTGWDQHWGTDQYFEGHPFLTEKSAEYLRDQGAVLVGIDTLNIDDTSAGTRPVHSTLLRAEIPIVEHMTNLSALPNDGFHFSAVPPKITSMEHSQSGPTPSSHTDKQNLNSSVDW